MTLQYVEILFQVIAFLFAISVHESAHAWMANRRGDPTARMLGRITLNPIKHIDPIGTVLLPLIALFAHIPMLGWAKPTPVNPRNFANPVLDDILTSVVGPVSNFVVAAGATIVLLAIKLTSPAGQMVIEGLTRGRLIHSESLMVPLCVLFHVLVEINVLLAVFNLLPVPPLDGSHVVRHLLPDPMRRVYDMMGFAGLMLLVYFGGGLLNALLSPVLSAFDWILLNA
ncbi:MAG: site-2 protease family protein [Acidobacteria bacterium]|nr:site-2 protease family protein [Acidobacteriota bacterium]MBV9623461.1 site-2 protease family protein [Acidobacteriota bacterium]